MLQPLDGPSKQGKLSSIDTITAVEAKVGASAFEDRKVVTLQPNGNMKVYFADDGETPSAATVLANGLDHYKNAKESYEAGAKQKIFILAASGTIDVVVVERA